MDRPRGARVDFVNGKYEVTYFGVYAFSVVSQTFRLNGSAELSTIKDKIEHPRDFEHITNLMKEMEKNVRAKRKSKAQKI
jgi:hypothetical protein